MADTSVAHTTDRGAYDEAQPVRASLERPGPESDEPMLLVPARGVHPRARGTMPVLRMRVSILHPGGEPDVVARKGFGGRPTGAPQSMHASTT